MPPSSRRRPFVPCAKRPRPTLPRAFWQAPALALIPLAVGFLAALGVKSLGPDSEGRHAIQRGASPAMATVSHIPPQLDIGPTTEVAPTPGHDNADRAAIADAPPAPQADEPSPEQIRDAALQKELLRVLVQGKTPYAATVLLEVGTGRVLATAEHSTRGPAEGLAQKPFARAASIFKIVTTSALLQAGVKPQTRVCTHGGRTRMKPKLLLDDRRRDQQCAAFADVLPRSLNVGIAKLTLSHLEPDVLRREAARWGFGEVLLPGGEPSTAPIPDDPFAFANTAAGFGEVKLSALHGAAIAAIVANDGVHVPLDGQEPRRVIPQKVAAALQEMMADTVSRGTGRRTFQQAPRLSVSAGGKTGSLTDYKTGLDASWFVGFAPADKPKVVVASVVVNTSLWHVKAPTVAKEALRAYFDAEKKKKRALVAQQ